MCETPSLEEIPEACTSELKTSSKFRVHSLLSSQLLCRIGNFVDITRFSSIHKLFRVTAFVLKFVRILKENSENPVFTLDALSEVE